MTFTVTALVSPLSNFFPVHNFQEALETWTAQNFNVFFNKNFQQRLVNW